MEVIEGRGAGLVTAGFDHSDKRLTELELELEVKWETLKEVNSTAFAL